MTTRRSARSYAAVSAAAHAATRALALACSCGLIVGLAACGPGTSPASTLIPPTGTPATPTPTPAAAPTTPLALEQTSVKPFAIPDFDAVHAPVAGDPNRFLIYGKIPVEPPAPDLPPELAAFLGRWEGYGDNPGVKKDMKIVTVLQSITEQDGWSFGWGGTNLQYPSFTQKVHFRVVPGADPAIEWQYDSPDYGTQINTFTYDRDQDVLRGYARLPKYNFTSPPIILTRGRSFDVYKDYPAYLAGLHISAKTYRNPDLARYGAGYLLYLPEGYEEHSDQTWPLIYFLHGSGDRGDNVYLLAKASPFMMIREHGPLPAIIAAPLLSSAAEYPAFPDDYVAGALAEIRADYQVDPQRVYVTGMSLGGIAAYRLAMRQPGQLAALAPLSTAADPETLQKIVALKDLPVRAIQGADDPIFPVAKARQAPDALQAAGGNVQFVVLPGHDHDTWTDTYADPAFYQWLLAQQRP